MGAPGGGDVPPFGDHGAEIVNVVKYWHVTHRLNRLYVARPLQYNLAWFTAQVGL